MSHGLLEESASHSHLMQCMEVWGGNQNVDSGVVMAGLDAWVYSRPYADSADGGDVYYVSSCATGRITRLLVADVSGHGADVRDVAVGLRTLMRRFVNHIDQAKFVKEMNAAFAAVSRNGGFATAVVTTFFSPTNMLSLCNAGHPVPLHYVASERKWKLLERPTSEQTAALSADDDTVANLPLGIIDLTDYDLFHVKLAVSDLVLCYTDSLIESCHGDGCTLIGQRGLLDIVNSMDVGDPATFIPRIQAKISELYPKNLTQDDVTLLLFRPNGLAPNTPLRERLKVPWRIARAVMRSWFKRDRAAPLPELSIANIGGHMVGSLNKMGPKPTEPPKQ